MSRRSGSKFQLQGILEVVDFVRVFFNSFVSWMSMDFSTFKSKSPLGVSIILEVGLERVAASHRAERLTMQSRQSAVTISRFQWSGTLDYCKTWTMTSLAFNVHKIPLNNSINLVFQLGNPLVITSICRRIILYYWQPRIWSKTVARSPASSMRARMETVPRPQRLGMYGLFNS
jgi:hypothetical protein